MSFVRARSQGRVLVVLAAWSFGPFSLADGRIAILGDEWLLSDDAFMTAPVDVPTLALDLASFLVGSSGNILTYSNNFGLTGSSLASTMTGAGYGWTVSTAQPFTLALLMQYDAVYLAGIQGSGAANAAVLAAYVQGGGSVLIAAGTGELGGAAGESIEWGHFLTPYGLQFGPSYIGPAATIVVPLLPSANPVVAGVSTIEWGFGQTAFEIVPSDPSTDAVFGDFAAFQLGDQPVIATYGSPCPAPCSGDLDNSGFVDGADLGALLGAWGPNGGPADLDCDGTVGGADLGLLLGAWGPC